ncbi:hypothetical protein [Methylobacterium nigriterrae]|uniref:hypothetical protein n=1 Tax=Methylobacterium nigriterrae TaxID=3127512 RepID=UPI0030132850
MLVSNFYWRMYQNFAMPSRISEYGECIRCIRRQGYEFVTIPELISTARLGDGLRERICILRNDVDTDPVTALAMREEECRAGVQSTYYFRLSTADHEIVKAVRETGAEVGYHYEELATIAKRLRLRTRAQVLPYMSMIRSEFRANFYRFSDICGFTPRTIASHGDFANRFLKMANTEIIDLNLRKELNIIVEAYDKEVENLIDARIIDRELPIMWSPESPEAAVTRGARFIRILVHPRQWRVNRLLNLREDLARICEGVKYHA